MMMRLPLGLSLILLLPLVWGGTDTKNYFINPSSSTGSHPVWTLGEQQVISWRTTLELYNISIWQQSLVQEAAASDYTVFSKFHNESKRTNFTWVVQLYDFDLDYSNVFFFWVNANEPGGFLSAFFNITQPTTPTAHSPSASGSQSTDSTADPAIPDTASGLSTTGKIALGVGIGIGVPVLATLGALVWLKARPARPLIEGGSKQVGGYPELGTQHPKENPGQPVVEMPTAASEISELPPQRHD